MFGDSFSYPKRIHEDIFRIQIFCFGCAWPIRARGYAWIWLDRPRGEHMLGYSHLGLVCCLLAEGAGL